MGNKLVCWTYSLAN